MFSFSAFLLFGKTLQTQFSTPPIPPCRPPTQRRTTVSGTRILCRFIIRSSFETTIIIIHRVGIYNIQLDITVIYPDGLRNNRINRLANAQHCGEMLRIINDIYYVGIYNHIGRSTRGGYRNFYSYYIVISVEFR